MIRAAALETRAGAGLTLLELLVATALGCMAAAAFAALLSAAVSARQRAAEGSRIVAAAAAAVDQIARDIRLAGYDPLGRGVTTLSSATRTSVVLAADLDGNGSVDTASEEQIGYRVSGGDTLQRTVGRQTLPILDDVAPNGLRLRYLDAAGVELDPAAPGTLTAVRALAIEVTTRATPRHGAVRVAGGARILNR